MCGGDIKIVERRAETTPRFGSSGGSIVSITPSPEGSEQNSFAVRIGLHSGGSAVEIPTTNKDTTPPTPNYLMMSVSPTPLPQPTNAGTQGGYFQFPPINPITAFNPLTLPPINQVHPTKIVHGGKIIPYVPGIPGPNSLAPPKIDNYQKRLLSPNRKMVSPLSLATPPATSPQSSSVFPSPIYPPRIIPTIVLASDVAEEKRKNTSGRNGYKSPSSNTNMWSTPPKESRKSFNYTRIADNLSPRKPAQLEQQQGSTTNKESEEQRYFVFEKPEMLLRTQEIKPQHISPLHIDVSTTPEPLKNPSVPSNEMPTSPTRPPSLPPPQQPTAAARQTTPQKPTKFLRPTTLPLKPGTFTPKHHHGITPTANTLPLISPETPRPSKSCVQLYLNGHAYTYLGLKCSTKPFYCTVNRPQPVHFTNQHKLSIYSNWQICAESDPHPLGFNPKTTMSLYDSRQRNAQFSIARSSPICTTLHSQSLIVTPIDKGAGEPKQQQQHLQQPQHQQHNQIIHQSQQLYNSNSNNIIAAAAAACGKSELGSGVPAVPGGYESNEDYTYVRGRGRGRYVCSECGIRCKKPSMLKKHIRTHTDVRPFTCQHCSFRYETTIYQFLFSCSIMVFFFRFLL